MLSEDVTKEEYVVVYKSLTNNWEELPEEIPLDSLKTVLPALVSEQQQEASANSAFGSTLNPSPSGTNGGNDVESGLMMTGHQMMRAGPSD
jgi:hypothetical protein